MTTETPLVAAETPHRVEIPFLRKWRSFGTGLGVEIGPENLSATLTAVRPNGIRVLDTLEILRYRERPAAEWGADFQAFLTKNRIRHLSATVVLPPADALSRSLPVPGVPEKELAAAVRYQLDGLHPFQEDEAEHSFSRLEAPHQSMLSVAIARTAVIQEYATIFDEAGIAVRAFLTPAAAIYSALRVLQLPPAEQFLAIHEEERGVLLYAETPTHPIYCVPFAQDPNRAIGLASAQIRLPEEAPVTRLASLLPHTEKLQLTTPLAYAASLAGALPSQALGINLLPLERRKTTSPLRYVPTVILLVLLMCIGVSIAYLRDYEDRKLLTRLDGEISKYSPALARVKALDTQIAGTQKRLDFLRDLASHPRQDLDSLRELTRIIPSSAYVNRMELTRLGLGLNGEIDQSAELLKLLDSSPLFKDAEFTSSPGRSQAGKEVFNIRAKRELPAPAAVPVSPAPGQAPAQPPVLPNVAPPPPLPAGLGGSK
ncbi:PilN domain-containing protein [Bryobacter aggregatus]|uniref:PilN domain-containing protein n=1 Tax=Bryobacter aggregatus TaxID=360054 RepID=UPI0004E12F20|nr:PilN domain-containing protein [Bryobacter aggregatus]